MAPIDPKRLNRKETLRALSRAVQVYWEHEKALPVPDHLAELAATADDAVAKRVAMPSIVPSPSVESGETRANVTQVKDADERC